MMLRLYTSLLSLSTLVVSNAAAGETFNSAVRQLEDSGYQYIDDLSGHYTTYISCFKVKIQNNNDDDAEGNSYFYNGKYHAQYNNYAAFHLCTDSSCNRKSCDYSTGYVTSLNDYLEKKVDFAQEYCEACQNQCRRRRGLADADNGIVIDCSNCKNQCSRMLNPGNNLDEANYLECQASDSDGDLQYYQAPTCSDGKIVMGLFYDEDCTVVSKATSELSFNYDTFSTVQSMCTSCDGNVNVCGELYEGASHCYGTSQMQGDGGNQVCKKYYDAVREVTYAVRKRKLHIRGTLLAVGLLTLCGSFLAHAYYIRHRNKEVNEKSVSLSQFDYGNSGPPSEDQPTTTPELRMT